MATKRTKKTNAKTAEQRKADMEALHERLTAQVEALRTSEEWLRYLRFCRAFHRYSLSNLLLILAQREDASQVAGYRVWQKLGRQVRKGERGIQILAPGTRKVTEEDPETGEETTTRRTFFFPVRVFDVSQTDPIEGAEVPEHPARALAGEDAAGLYDTVAAHLAANGVTIERQNLGGARNGYTTKTDEAGHLLVVIDEDLSPAQAAKTILHEAAHIALGHLDDDYREYVEHRGRYEVEAESVAYVVAGLLGVDTSAYSVGYVTSWAHEAEADVIKDTASRVLSAVHSLAEDLGITEADEDRESAA